ncbi:hypothetical protein CYLTODRAFT_376607 [Cylindrobasidium torrendii FP15055 ss-10]|uniref:BSD domain-containing protein n=1 Tax=Cylindrobasidium torrendii FP15055 ss-10 TaxID=1314674 RepID=A0A0D7BAF8_9AGAR|nr:hypothetical protein CYLTODRAFT_376607 [Cylindrobasidium torrendii FP15055 ss-10]
MNYLDPLDVTGGTNTPPVTAPQQSLDEEVNQVIGQLSRFWGGFRKQSEAALATATKDFSGVVTSVQAQAHRLSESQSSIATATQGESSTRSVDGDGPTTPTTQSSPSMSTQTPTFFARLQAALPPNIAQTVQNNIPETLKNADYAQIRTNLAAEFQRVQGVTRAQAEEYVHKSETLLRDAYNEASEVLKDAVRVIPPDDTSGAGFIWDGSDMWMLPTPAATPAEPTEPGDKGKGKAAAVATRAEALLKRLKHDSDIIRHDPEADEQYKQWIEAEVTPKGGIQGEEWAARIAEALADHADGAALKANLDTLVPEEITNDVFWTRYFFRAQQITQEESRRQALIQASTETTEDFAWEDDEDESHTPAASSSVVAPVHEKQPPSISSSPRQGSEDSYDVVSGNTSEVVGKESKAAKPTGAESTDSDSDWE